MTLFLLTVFGLLLAAGVKTRIAKAGLASELPWHNGRRWWEVSNACGYMTREACSERVSNRHGLREAKAIISALGKCLGVQTTKDSPVAMS